MLSDALFLVIIAISVVAWLLGHKTGYDRGRERGFMEGRRDGQKGWIKAMEAKRGPSGALNVDHRDALLRILPPNRENR